MDPAWTLGRDALDALVVYPVDDLFVEWPAVLAAEMSNHSVN